MAASEAAAAAIAAEQTLGVVISHVLAEEDQQTEKRRKRGERERKSKRERERERERESRDGFYAKRAETINRPGQDRQEISKMLKKSKN
jgi:hypothetical protein